MTILIIYAVLAIGVSFLCSLLEASILSIPRGHVEMLVEKGSRTGRRLLEMKQQIDRPLAAILTFNTIAHTVGAAGVGAQAAHIWGDSAVGLAGALMTLLILVLSEIIPKTLGAVHAKSLATATAFITHLMIIICYPLTLSLEFISGAIGYQREKDQISRAELAATVNLGWKAGTIALREFKTVSNMLALDEVSVTDILTPRTVVLSLPVEMTVAEAIDKYKPIRFSRIPVYEHKHDHVKGYVARSDIYELLASGSGDKKLGELVKPILVMPEQSSVYDLMTAMLQKQQHIALIVDEYGGMEGIATLEDAVETLLGVEIVDETDTTVDMRELARRKKRKQ